MNLALLCLFLEGGQIPNCLFKSISRDGWNFWPRLKTDGIFGDRNVINVFYNIVKLNKSLTCTEAKAKLILGRREYIALHLPLFYPSGNSGFLQYIVKLVMNLSFAHRKKKENKVHICCRVDSRKHILGLTN